MNTATDDPRLVEILHLLSQLSDKDWATDCQGGESDVLDCVLEGLRTIHKQHKEAQRNQDEVKAIAEELEALREREARLRLIVENLPVMIDALDEHFNIVVWNKACERVTGYSAAEMIGNPHAMELLYPDKTYFDLMMARFAALGRNFHDQETRLTGKDGVERIVTWSSVPEQALTPGGQVWAVGIDMTERRQAEDELWQSRQMLQLILDHMPSAVLWKDRNSVYLGCNRQNAVLAGLESAQDIVGLTDDEIPNTSPESARLFRDIDQRVMSSDSPELDYEELGSPPGGSPRWLKKSKVPLHDSAGHVIGVLAVIDNITERKRIEESLRTSEARLREAQMVAHIGNWDWNLVTNELYWSDQTHRIYGLNPQEFSPDITGFMQRVHPDDLDNLQQAIKETLAGQPFVLSHRIVRPDGQIRWVDERGQVIFDEHEAPVRMFGTTQDVTERKLAELERQKLVDIVETSTDFIGIAYLDGQLQYVNPAGLRLLGISSLAEVRKMHITDVLPPEQQDKFTRERLPALVKTGRWFGEGGLKHLVTGETIPVEMSSFLIRDAGSGEPVAFANVSRDITERKRAETAIQQLNRELEARVVERTAKLEAANAEIRNFAYIVSHDLRAPLVNLKGFAAELRFALKAVEAVCAELLPLVDEGRRDAVLRALHEDIPEALRYIESSVSHMDGFTKAMLKLSRLGRQQLDLTQVDVRSVVDAVLRTMAYQIDERAVRVTIGDLPSVTADLVSMEIIFGNMFTNAVAYLLPGRPGQIEISGERLEHETLFRIRDNGRGIAQEDMKNVFAPFRRAGKQNVPGEGMGLAYVQTLVRRHGGRIWCESEPGVGTTFTFTIAARLTTDAKQG